MGCDFVQAGAAEIFLLWHFFTLTWKKKKTNEELHPSPCFFFDSAGGRSVGGWEDAAGDACFQYRLGASSVRRALHPGDGLKFDPRRLR